MKFLILGAAMIAAASAIIAQIDPTTGEIINSLPGILVSKRLVAPLPTYLPDDPYDWLTGILVSKKEAVSSLVRREVLDAAVDSNLLSKRIITLTLTPDDWLFGVLVSKKEVVSSLVRREALDDAVDSNLLSKRIVALPTSSTFDFLDLYPFIVSKREAISSLVRKGAIDDAIDDLTSLTKKEAIESLVRKRAAIDTFDIGDVSVMSK